ncbi:MAG: hypothetical protein HZA20_02785 [Nitrospirae bacterium]|jgi:hypothetical protein|nr:hypothetical protein [Nitrospirota bacterium]
MLIKKRKQIMTMSADYKNPHLNFTILCDDVRQEMGGRMSIMGVFENIYAEQLPAIHLRLGVINEWIGGKGDHNATVRIYTPDRSRLMAESKTKLTMPPDSRRCRQISMFLNLEFKIQGTYWIDVLLDDNVLHTLPLPVIQIPSHGFH